MPTKKAPAKKVPAKKVTATKAVKESPATAAPAGDQGGTGKTASSVPPEPDFVMTFDRMVPLYAFAAILYGISDRYPESTLVQYPTAFPWPGPDDHWSVAVKLGPPRVDDDGYKS